MRADPASLLRRGWKSRGRPLAHGRARTGWSAGLSPEPTHFDVQRVADHAGGQAGAGPSTLSSTTRRDGRSRGPTWSLLAKARHSSRGRTDENGRLSFTLGGPPRRTMTVSAPGRGSKTWRSPPIPQPRSRSNCSEAGTVAASITDEKGGSRSRARFSSSAGTVPRPPTSVPTAASTRVKNLYYSHDGLFRRELAPGSYDVIISHGPGVRRRFHEGSTWSAARSRLWTAKLIRSVKTDGWISADFHSHSSPSGDNTSSQLGRVLNLLCEHVEFAPCTEHNRLSTYDPHLKRLGAERRMATCVGN